MSRDPARLAKLVRLQSQLKRAGDMRLAQYLAEVRRIEGELEDIERAVSDGSFSTTVFPDLYARHADRLIAEKDRNMAAARKALGAAQTETARLGSMKERYRISRVAEERRRQEQDGYEAVERSSFNGDTGSRKIGRIK